MEKYTKLKNIGKGNMGACYLMRNNDDGRQYVMKQIDLVNMSKRERKQALNEARVLNALKHPNIINYVDSFLARKTDHLCIVMEYADAGDIAARLKSCRGHLKENVILDWFIQTCLAINCVHQKHILHRDVKTQNIFLTSQGIVKVGDFGIARELNNTFDQAHTFVGTPYYLSPELVQERPYDARSDVWALGVVLYEMMALKHPFNANDMKSLMTKIIRVTYDPPPSYYSQELREIVAKVLVKDPRSRMTLGAILSTPVIRRRLSQWVSGNAGVPPPYLELMLKHRLLPGYTRIREAGLQQQQQQQQQLLQQQQQGEGERGSQAVDSPSHQRDTPGPSPVGAQRGNGHSGQALNGAAHGKQPAHGDHAENGYDEDAVAARRRRLEAEIEADKAYRRELIKREFSDMKSYPSGSSTPQQPSRFPQHQQHPHHHQQQQQQQQLQQLHQQQQQQHQHQQQQQQQQPPRTGNGFPPQPHLPAALPRMAPSPSTASTNITGLSRPRLADPFVAQNKALRRNLGDRNPDSVTPTSAARDDRVGNPPDSLRQRELMKEKELHGMMSNMNYRQKPQQRAANKLPADPSFPGVRAPALGGLGDPALPRIPSSAYRPAPLPQPSRPDRYLYQKPQNYHLPSNLSTPSGKQPVPSLMPPIHAR